MTDTGAMPYSGFAWAYDEMMTNVDYLRWAQYVVDVFALYGTHPKRVLDLACGTGSVAIPLSKDGYDLIGLDQAQEMLDVAERKSEEAEVQVEWVQGDMRDFSFGDPFDAVLCLYDSINYALDVDELTSVCRCVHDALVPAGLFIFDITTERNIAEHFHLQTFTENRRDYSYIWKNIYTRHDKICRTELTFFIRQEDSTFERRIETHLQKIFDVKEVERALADADLELLGTYDAWTLHKHHRNSDRIHFAARRRPSS